MDRLDGKILIEKYSVERFIKDGENCKLYKVKNMRKDNSQKPLVAKIKETST